jgi:hypothetical protein
VRRQFDHAQEYRQQMRRAGKLQRERSESQQVLTDAVVLPDRDRRGLPRNCVYVAHRLPRARPPNLEARFLCSTVGSPKVITSLGGTKTRGFATGGAASAIRRIIHARIRFEDA